MSGSNVPGRRGTRKTRGRPQERTRFAYLLDYEGLRLEPADPSPRLGHDDHVWFQTTFINYCGRHGGRRPTTARVELSIPGSRIEEHVKQALSQDMEGAAAALAEESDRASAVGRRRVSGTPGDEWRVVYDTPKADQGLSRLTVSVRPPGGRMTRAGGRGTLLGVPRTEANKRDSGRDSSTAGPPTIGPTSDVETRASQGGLGADAAELGGLQLPAQQLAERETALAQLRETLERVRAHATDDPEFGRLALRTIEDYASEVRAMAPPSPRSGTRAEPPRIGHPIIEGLAKLWDEREATPRLELVRRFQENLNRFHEAKSLGSYELNRAAAQWVNRLASRNSIKLRFRGEAVTIYCANRGEAGLFLPRYAKGHSEAVKGAGTYEFPELEALPL